MSDTPNFRDLVGEGLPPAEQERLERVHEMLIAAGPPPELPPELEEVPDERGNVRRLEPTGTVLITGGVGELGRELARHLVDRHRV